MKRSKAAPRGKPTANTQLSLRLPTQVLRGVDDVAELLSGVESVVVINGTASALPPRKVTRHYAAVFALQYGIKKLLEDSFVPESPSDEKVYGSILCDLCGKPLQDTYANPAVMRVSNLSGDQVISYRHTKCAVKESES